MLILLPASYLIAQDRIAFYDALDFAKLYREHQSEPLPRKIPLTNTQVAKILSSYAPGADDLAAEIAGNIFLSRYFSSGGNTSLRKQLDPAGIGNAIGNLNVTSLADGFARFLVKRTKEELNAAFFSKFAELIAKPEYRDAQILFPQTYATLLAIGDEVYNYEAYLNSLRESFVSDLNSLLPNLEKVIGDGRYATFFSVHPELKAICLSTIHVGKQL